MSTDESTDEMPLDAHLVARLPQVLAYLRMPSLWAVLLGLAVISWFLGALSFGFGGLVGLLIAGLEIGVFFQITRSSAQGTRTLDAPDFLSIYDSIVHPILLVVMAALPMLVAGYLVTADLLGGTLPDRGWPPGPLALFVAGLLLYPLLLTIAAIDRSIANVLNPMIWVKSLRSLGTNYVIAAVVFYGLWALEVYFVARVAMDIENLPIPGSTVPALMVLYVPRVLRYRLLGALCEPFLSEDIQSVVAAAPEKLPVAQYDDSHERLQELESGTMSSRAILRMANTALMQKRPRLVYRAVEHLWKHHPDSPEIVQALWLASQAQESEGHIEAMKVTLSKLVAHHPGHPMASEARLKLRRL